MHKQTSELFEKFLKSIKEEIELIIKSVLEDWEKNKQQGILSNYIRNTINSFRKNIVDIITFRNQSTTLVANLNEYLIGYLVKEFFSKFDDKKYKVLIEKNFSGKKRPDIRIDRDEEPVAIIELKFYLKNQNYKAEKERREFYKSKVKFYGLLQFWSCENILIKNILIDNCDWIYLINYDEQIMQIQNNKKDEFWSEENKKKAIEKLAIINPIERLFDEILKI